jgi:hypothetical protein
MQFGAALGWPAIRVGGDVRQGKMDQLLVLLILSLAELCKRIRQNIFDVPHGA